MYGSNVPRRLGRIPPGIVFVGLKLLLSGYTIPAGSPRIAIELSGPSNVWKFSPNDPGTAAASPSHDDSSWTHVTLPHTWNAFDAQDGGGDYRRGAGWYRFHYTPPSYQAGRRFYLKFDGMGLVSDIYLNGALLYQKLGAFSTVVVAATATMRVGTDNVIAVRVSNAHNAAIAPLSGDFGVVGGLHRKVHVLVTDQIHIDMLDYGGPGVYLTPSIQGSNGVLGVRAKVYNDFTGSRTVRLTTEIKDRSGVTVATAASPYDVALAGPGASFEFTQHVIVPAVTSWNGRQNPYLYTAQVRVSEVVNGSEVVRDMIEEKIGFRRFSFNADTGAFLLNGVHQDVRGVNMHQDRLDKSWAISDADRVEDVNLALEMGTTALRLAHYQHDQKTYDLADENGLLVWTEIPLVDCVSRDPNFPANTENQLRELIRQNFNHPSVIFWGISNEIDNHMLDGSTLKAGCTDPYLSTLSPDTREALLKSLRTTLLGSLRSIAADEERRLSYAPPIPAPPVPSYRLSAHAARGLRSPYAPDIDTDVTGYNQYFGWYDDFSANYNDIGQRMDEVHRLNPGVRMALGEFGAGAGIRLHAEAPVKEDHTEEYQSRLHEAHLQAIDARPYLWGKFIWNMFDLGVAPFGDTESAN
jgi:beta-galactosidase